MSITKEKVGAASVSKSVYSPAESRPKAAGEETRHVAAKFLGLHALGDLPVFQRWQVEEHLSRCGSCRNQLRRVADVIAVFRAEVSTANA
jgi:predicted anti-sigma-YlaC factor YlaD